MKYASIHVQLYHTLQFQDTLYLFTFQESTKFLCTLHNLARTPGMYMMPLKLAQKSVSSLYTKLAISSLLPYMFYFIKTHTLISLDKEKVAVVVEIGLNNQHKC